MQVSRVCYNSTTGPNTVMVSTSSASHTITGLTALTTCCIIVAAGHTSSSPSCTSTTFGPSVEMCGTTTDDAPGAVVSLTVEAISSSVLYATWKEPLNYARPGLMYNISWSPDAGSEILNQLTQYAITGLRPSTEYIITVFAISPISEGANLTRMQTTLSLPPTPPTNPLLSVSGSDITFSWDVSTALDTRYLAQLNCDNVEFFTTVSHPTASVTFDTSSVTGTVWCVAVVQAINSVTSSEFSERVSIVRPVMTPTKPRCYFTGNMASNATVSYTVTYPFILDKVTVEYRLYSSTDPMVTGTDNFTAFTYNNVFILVNRDTQYQFDLRLCNSGECGPYCDRISFNTESVSTHTVMATVCVLHSLYCMSILIIIALIIHASL